MYFLKLNIVHFRVPHSVMAVMQEAAIAGNAQYMLYINSDKYQQKATSKSNLPTIVRRFELNWKFYNGMLTSEKRLQIAA